jgi:hypothetical protein
VVKSIQGFAIAFYGLAIKFHTLNKNLLLANELHRLAMTFHSGSNLLNTEEHPFDEAAILLNLALITWHLIEDA